MKKKKKKRKEGKKKIKPTNYLFDITLQKKKERKKEILVLKHILTL